MKKIGVIVSLVVLSLMVSSSGFAQEPVKSSDATVVKTDKAENKPHFMGKGMKENKMMGPMMGQMMTKQMVATSDGGVVVLCGNKITKYDKNLTLVKEAEIKMDMEGIKECMMERKNEHHMGMKNKGGKEEADESIVVSEPVSVKK